jgi:hypothetical protein
LPNIRKVVETLRKRGDDLATVTLISDGTTVYECRSPEEIVDLLQGGQGVFAIALSGAWKEIQGELSQLPMGERGVSEPMPSVAERADVDADVDAEVATEADATPVVDELAARRARRRAG